MLVRCTGGKGGKGEIRKKRVWREGGTSTPLIFGERLLDGHWLCQMKADLMALGWSCGTPRGKLGPGQFSLPLPAVHFLSGHF